MFWSHTRNDLTTLVSLKTQYELAVSFQIYESFRLVAGEALGGTSSGSNTAGVKPVESFDELVAKFAGIGGHIGG